ncbi:CLUMA_CG012425, isoform A [Clunio marinus]|uniref:CLUMA_CG012425, isoform A n=1 Tax=Clunio marinus TaxID=568069 RepID=A0A1J1IKG3_9DIPT|nr:CLUMA_CG012425, isoform A [Clunio marinus]
MSVKVKQKNVFRRLKYLRNFIDNIDISVLITLMKFKNKISGGRLNANQNCKLNHQNTENFMKPDRAAGIIKFYL